MDGAGDFDRCAFHDCRAGEGSEFPVSSRNYCGGCVKLREKLAWVEKQPLFGKRILVTRARSQASELVELIENNGGEAVEFPVIRVQAPCSREALGKFDEALASLHVFDWAVFTSANGVEFFFLTD